MAGNPIPLSEYRECSVCGERRTKHETGICSLCRLKLEVKRHTCTICGEHSTAHPSGVCSVCRRKVNTLTAVKEVPDISQDFLDALIYDHIKYITILTGVKKGDSLSKIGAQTGMTKAQVKNALQKIVSEKRHNVANVAPKPAMGGIVLGPIPPLDEDLDDLDSEDE